MKTNMKMVPLSRMLLMAAIHFGLMFALMYAMVDQFGNVLPNLNQVYMAGIMTTPMIVLEGLLMGDMYHNRKIVNLISVISLAIFGLLFYFIRQQTAITDQEFLKSMIPHHAGAILMCQKAPITDPEIKTLCDNILTSQQAEIDFMRRKLE